MPVRSADGLVGRIIDVGPLASRVLLVSDRASIVPARLLRGGIPVIAQGRGDGTVEVRPLEVGRNPFKPGDLIITSGTGGLYPPRVPVARVVKLKDDGAVAHCPCRSRNHELRDRGAALRAGCRRCRTEPQPSPDGPRRPLFAEAVRPGPDALRAFVPAATVVASSLLAALPIVSTGGWFPDFGYLALISWRLLRADPWPAWWAAPLGLVNDLFTGYPLGFSIALWSATMLALDLSIAGRCGAITGSSGWLRRC